ncbi:pantothenate kinase, partial [Francisella tularensis subsp. holarctica]|nr:pantothenate kinase [Francisella tularensis subsp. holarctica]
EFGSPVYTIATGGFAGFIKEEDITNEISPDLI